MTMPGPWDPWFATASRPCNYIARAMGTLVWLQLRTPAVPVYETDGFTADTDGGAGGPAIDSGAQ